MALYIGSKRTFGTLFQVKKESKYVDANLSTGEKLEDDTYKNSSWTARFIGKAFDKAKELSDGARIEIVSAKVEKIQDKNDKTKYYTNLIVFEIKTPSELEAERAAIANTDPNA